MRDEILEPSCKIADPARLRAPCFCAAVTHACEEMMRCAITLRLARNHMIIFKELLLMLRSYALHA